ncbi:MAG: hypothetical protein ACK4VW_01915 [Anaerolineales bacterium]
MDDKRAMSNVEAEEEQPMQERFCEVSVEEIADFAAESAGSRLIADLPQLGFVP